MKYLSVLAIALASVAAPAIAGGKHPHRHHAYSVDKHTIIVSCFRGPWKEVIWDRPNSKFVESLVDVGYDYPTAHSIAERVCRDDRLVGNPEGLKQTMTQIFWESPYYRENPHIHR